MKVLVVALLVLAALVGVTVALAQAGALPFDGGSTTECRTGMRDGVPEEVCEIKLPDPARLPTPTTYGDFLIVPFGSPADLPDGPNRDLVGKTRVTGDMALLTSDPLFGVAGYLPGPQTGRAEARGLSDDLGLFQVTTTYGYTNAQGEGRSIEIVRWRPAKPMRIQQPPQDSVVALELGYVGVQPAVIKGPKIEQSEEGRFDLYWFDGDILSTIYGAGTLADLLKVAEAVSGGTPGGEGEPSGPESSAAEFSIDLDPGVSGTQATRTVPVGSSFNLVVLLAAGVPWEAYQITLFYNDLRLDAVVPSPDEPWTESPIEGVRGGNRFAFTTTPAVCTPSLQGSSVNLEDDFGQAKWAMTCAEAVSGTEHSGGGALVEIAFKCESAGSAVVSLTNISDTFLLRNDHSKHNNLQSYATVTCQ